MTKHTKPGSGGKRIGSGQPKKEETTNVNLRIPVKIKNELAHKYPKRLNSMFLEWVKTL